LALLLSPLATEASTSAFVKLTTNASRHHAVTSPVAAQLSASTRLGVHAMRSSVRIRAKTGKAVIVKAACLSIWHTLARHDSKI
jgi:hypothetical protein